MHIQPRSWLLWLLILGGLSVLGSCGHAPTPSSKHPVGMFVPRGTAYNQFALKRNIQERASGEWGIIFFYPEADTPG